MFPNFAELQKTGDRLTQQFDEIIALLRVIAENTTSKPEGENHG